MYEYENKQTFGNPMVLKQTTAETCILISNGAPTHNYGPGAFRFHECGGKVNTRREGYNSLSIFSPFKFYIYSYFGET